jgi:hypothetical protein
MGTLSFRNDVQACLWENEIRGQISDGHWENARPSKHWEAWCGADVIVDPTDLGRDFHVERETYALKSRDLLSVVGGRMVGYARLCLFYGREATREVLEYFVDCGEQPYEPQFGGVREWWTDERKAAISQYDLAEIQFVITNKSPLTTDFGRKELLHELADMQQIMRFRRGSGQVPRPAGLPPPPKGWSKKFSK